MPRAHPRWGIEFDWLGVDLHGHVAMFATAGYGPVPVRANEHFDKVDAALDRVSELQVVGRATDRVSPGRGNYSDWHAFSARGIYAYNWHFWHGPYQRLSSPSVPVSVGQLPSAVQMVARYMKFSECFAQASNISIEYTEPPIPQ